LGANTREIELNLKAEHLHWNWNDKLDFGKPSSVQNYFSIRDLPATAVKQAAIDIKPRSGK
jgi:hypothetical protein